jgi:hypothetical protein
MSGEFLLCYVGVLFPGGVLLSIIALFMRSSVRFTAPLPVDSILHASALFPINFGYCDPRQCLIVVVVDFQFSYSFKI